MKKLINYFLQKSSRKELVFWFITTYLLYFYMILFTIPQLEEFTGGLKIPDMMPTGYDQTYLFNLLVALGQKGRNLYLFKQIPFDMIYPFLYGFSFTLLLAYIYKLLYTRDMVIRYLCLIPFVAAFFDYAENIAIANLLYTFPFFSVNIARLANLFTILKSTITVISFILVFAGVIGVVIRRLIDRFGNKGSQIPE